MERTSAGNTILQKAQTDYNTISNMNFKDIIHAIKPLDQWNKVDSYPIWSGYEIYTKHKNLLRILYYYNTIHISLYNDEHVLILNKSFDPDISTKDIIDYLTNLFERPFKHP